jgi:hypothetical protein
MMQDILIITFLLVTFFAAIFVIPGLMVRRAAYKVIDTFCRYEALEPRKAREQGEMGLNPPTFFERFLKPRDYKPHALQMLHQADVVRFTEDGKLYMDQDKLHEGLRCKPMENVNA